MNVRAFLRRNFSANCWQHGPRLVISVRLIVILRETSIVTVNVAISARSIRLVLDADIPVNQLGSVQFAGTSEGPRKALGSPLNLGAIEWKHFIYIKI